MNRISVISFSLLLLTVILHQRTADAVDMYPSKPIRFVVPFPPGGSDTVARILAQKLSTSMNQSFIIDNRAGAGGLLGSAIAAKSAPDGYTLLFATASYPINANLYSKLQFDPVKDFSAIALICSGPESLVVSASVSARSVQEFIDLAKAKPGVLNYASTGTGSITHLAGELFTSMSGISLIHVPYKGTGEAMTQTMGGQVQAAFVPIGAALPFARAGKLRILGVGSMKRSPIDPNVPTIAEAGIPGYEVLTWYGVLAPARTSFRVVSRLNSEINAILVQADMLKQLSALGFDATPGTPEEFDRYLKAEIKKWGVLVSKLGLRQ